MEDGNAEWFFTSFPDTSETTCSMAFSTVKMKACTSQRHTHLNHWNYITQHTTSVITSTKSLHNIIKRKWGWDSWHCINVYNSNWTWSPNWCSVLLLNRQVNGSYLALLVVLWSSTHHLHTGRTQEVTSSNWVTWTAAGHSHTYSDFCSGGKKYIYSSANANFYFYSTAV